jgi:hypothetical protein
MRRAVGLEQILIETRQRCNLHREEDVMKRSIGSQYDAAAAVRRLPTQQPWRPTVDTFGNSRSQYVSRDAGRVPATRLPGLGVGAQQAVQGAVTGGLVGAAAGAAIAPPAAPDAVPRWARRPVASAWARRGRRSPSRHSSAPT